MKYCKYCGKKLHEGGDFCISCGKQIKDVPHKKPAKRSHVGLIFLGVIGAIVGLLVIGIITIFFLAFVITLVEYKEDGSRTYNYSTTQNTEEIHYYSINETIIENNIEMKINNVTRRARNQFYDDVIINITLKNLDNEDKIITSGLFKLVENPETSTEMVREIETDKFATSTLPTNMEITKELRFKANGTSKIFLEFYEEIYASKPIFRIYLEDISL